MKILFIGDKFRGDDSYLTTLARTPALQGHHVATSFTPRENATEVAMLAKSKGFDAVITTQASLLKAALKRLPDYIPPPPRKQISIDDYAGSMIELPYGIPLLILNSLERSYTVPYEKFLQDRFTSKLTKPSRWFKQLPFHWSQVVEGNAKEIADELRTADLCAIDIETPGDDDRSIKLVGYAAYWRTTGKIKIYVVHITGKWAIDFVRRANNAPSQKIFQNGQYDNCYFARWNCLPYNWLWDTYHLLHCWYSELPKRLDFIAAFAIRNVRYWKDDGKTGSLEDEMRYNALDVWATLNGFLGLMSEIPAWAAENYAQAFPMNFPSITVALEGIRIDVEKFKEVQKQKEEEAASGLARLRRILGSPTFNPRSPEQMKNLFTLLGCGTLPNTAAASMMKARAAHPLNDVILGMAVDYKKAAKLISSYLQDDLLWQGRWFTTIDTAGTDTNRGASRESAFWCGDNIQNIPRGDILKQCFLADEGWLLGEADKKQSEARCVGYLSGEEKLITLVEGPHDYHAWNAQAFFGVPYEKIFNDDTGETLDKDLRDLSKRTNHGANYNMGENVMLDTMGPKKVALAKLLLKLPPRLSLLSVCRFLLDRYAETYPNVKGRFYQHITQTIELTNKLISPLGWTRWFFSKPSKGNKPALNAAVAHSPQNLSVSIINKEWYAIWRESIYGDLRGKVRIKAQIHDSLLFQYKGDGAQEAVRRMNTSVQVTGTDNVTRTMLIPTDLKCGAIRWSEIR